ncbi:AraC family transcriptional regulator [Spirosoma endbachense]|uniref:Helix-turn-helix domain-containing protein n=1 Tax=Spirosoma endbachense TaxID=2666025 RepID=A0A6P1W3F6_9BACT|nr:helix-turn-helix domain-containing protein [Spirosoma endbachense]QHV99585.1 helix-turn-helix domain-containing protein [Spirosoma endbachense]
MQLVPSPELSGLVKHYLIIENQVDHTPIYRFFPDGHTGFVFTYADPLTQYYVTDQPLTLPNSFVYGQANRYHTLLSGKKIGMLIVVLQPWGLHVLSGIPGNETTNNQISLSSVFGNDGSRLQEQILNDADNASRIKRIELFLLKHWQGLSYESVSVQAAIQRIHQTKGSTTVQELTRHLSVTERSLERRFDKVMGIRPKQFARIIRLQHCLKIHRENPALTLTELAYSTGYYDQAHFIREFTNLVGITPTQYDANAQRLAVNLMPLDPSIGT